MQRIDWMVGSTMSAYYAETVVHHSIRLIDWFVTKPLDVFSVQFLICNGSLDCLIAWKRFVNFNPRLWNCKCSSFEVMCCWVRWFFCVACLRRSDSLVGRGWRGSVLFIRDLLENHSYASLSRGHVLNSSAPRPLYLPLLFPCGKTSAVDFEERKKVEPVSCLSSRRPLLFSLPPPTAIDFLTPTSSLYKGRGGDLGSPSSNEGFWVFAFRRPLSAADLLRSGSAPTVPRCNVFLLESRRPSQQHQLMLTAWRVLIFGPWFVAVARLACFLRGGGARLFSTGGTLTSCFILSDSKKIGGSIDVFWVSKKFYGGGGALARKPLP